MSITTRRLVVPATQPRNPCVAPARFRQAGAHGQRGGAAERRAGRDALRREMKDLPAATRGRPPSP